MGDLAEGGGARKGQKYESYGAKLEHKSVSFCGGGRKWDER